MLSLSVFLSLLCLLIQKLYFTPPLPLRVERMDREQDWQRRLREEDKIKEEERKKRKEAEDAHVAELAKTEGPLNRPMDLFDSIFNAESESDSSDDDDDSDEEKAPAPPVKVGILPWYFKIGVLFICLLFFTTGLWFY